jgi:ABC-type transport system involved in multi-copper enzyme maturation permease subunit
MPSEPLPGSQVSAEPTAWRSFLASVSAVFGKESRWRMRGRRAFVVVTVYLALLALLVLSVYQIIYQAAIFQASFGQGMPSADFVPGSAATTIGQAIFTKILVVQNILIVLLAPALTSGAISNEREKQTLELLITTPVSTLGMVIGKLLASLAYVFILIVASVPLMSLVFVFGGVAPEDVVRVYVLLFTVAIGSGAVGLFMSALTKRTQVATALAYVVGFALTIGLLLVYMYILATPNRDARGNFIAEQHPPEILLWLNPFVADIVLICTAIPESFSPSCSLIERISGGRFDPTDPPRDTFWPKAAISGLLFGATLTLLTTQLIAPSRRVRRQRARSLPPPDELGAIPTEPVGPN